MKPLSMNRLIPLALIALAGATFAACGDGSVTSMTSPTPVGGPAAVQSGVLAGNVVTPDGSSAATSAGFRTMKQPARGLTITVVGTGLTVTTDASGGFVIEGVPAGTTITLHFSGPGVDATLTLGSIVEGQVLHITVRVEGTSAELEDEDDVEDEDEDKEEIEGLISAITTAPPTITVNGLVVGVPDGTPIVHGSRSYAFGDLHVGDRVHVKAQLVGGSLVATEVKLQNDDDDDGDDKDKKDDDGPGHGSGHDDDNGHGNGHNS